MKTSAARTILRAAHKVPLAHELILYSPATHAQ
jgi:hypothetical protein